MLGLSKHAFTFPPGVMYSCTVFVSNLKTSPTFVDLFVFQLIIYFPRRSLPISLPSLGAFYHIPVSCLEFIATICMLVQATINSLENLQNHHTYCTIHTAGLVLESDTRSGNHASILLLMGELSSVRLNMTKAGPNNTEGTYNGLLL